MISCCYRILLLKLLSKHHVVKKGGVGTHVVVVVVVVVAVMTMLVVPFVSSCRTPGAWALDGAHVVSWFVDTSRSSDDWIQGRRLVKGVINPNFFFGLWFSSVAIALQHFYTFLRAVWKNLLHAKQPEREICMFEIYS